MTEVKQTYRDRTNDIFDDEDIEELPSTFKASDSRQQIVTE